MVTKIADNIYSPLGTTTAENYAAVKAGRSAIRLYEGVAGVPEPFYASLIDREQLAVEGDYTPFEWMCIQSVREALSQTQLDPASDRVIFILSTTKGNVALLAKEYQNVPRERVLIPDSASRIARYFGNRNMPIAVSNACISGVCAQIMALRALRMGDYDYAVVVGADQQSPFIITGFQSFKALAPEPCRPFDTQRQGLNLGEAAATVIYARTAAQPSSDQWELVEGAVRNDANHISGPSRTGEGSYLVLSKVLRNQDASQLAFVNCHGTATLYNDEMESIALQRAGLIATPINSLKGYYGHTMGAAGVLESIISMHAVDDHTVLGTRNFETLGVSNPVNVSSANRATDKRSFVKLISGFGGCNAAALFRKGGQQ